MRERLTKMRGFLTFAGSSLLATGIDQLVAWVLFFLIEVLAPELVFYRILIGSAVARVVSVSVNYTLNSKRVFRCKSNRRALPRFIALAVFVLGLSTLGVYLLHTEFGIDEKFAKIVVDLGLFFVNFYGQKYWVFAEKKATQPQVVSA